MGEIIKTSERNTLIGEMLSNGESLKDFCRFVAWNPNINLHDACQIVINRPKASICFSLSEWNDLNRRVIKGKKGIPFYDENGTKHYVFDLYDTHGERYVREIYPINRMLKGLSNIIDGKKEPSAFLHKEDVEKISEYVDKYLDEYGYYFEDEKKDKFLRQVSTALLYYKTGFPKDNNVILEPFSTNLKENADFFKTAHTITGVLFEEIERGYKESLKEVKVIDDINEENITDEVSSVKSRVTEDEHAGFTANEIKIQEPKQEKVEQPQRQGTPIYQRYMETQDKYKDSFVVMRLGDFYEVFGDKATEVANILDLTLTGRDCGLEERVKMCGFPYHVAEVYIEKLLQENSVVVIEEGIEPKYIQSGKELQPLQELTDDEKEESIEDYYEEIAEYERQKYEEANSFLNEDYEDEEDEYEDEEYNEREDYIDSFYEERQQEEKEKTTTKKKNNDRSQMSLFGLLGEEPEEKSREDKFIDGQMKRGSGFKDGKFRIYEKYQSGVDTDEFAKFLKDEYGIGGYGSPDGDEQQHDAKGVRMSFEDKNNPENNINVIYTWKQVAERISDLIDEGTYLNAEEKEEYERYRKERYGTDEERITAVADDMVLYGLRYSKDGTSEQFFSYHHAGERFCEDHKDEIIEKIKAHKEVLSVDESNWITLTLDKQYCLNLRDNADIKDENLNTNLEEVGLDQNDLGGAKARFRSNVEAIKLVKRLEKFNTLPTNEEKLTLAKYVGWGGISKAFDKDDENWQKEYSELKELLTTDEYEVARGSTLNAHFTPKTVISAMYKALERFGVKGNNKVLEPALGTGNFFGFMPKEIKENAKLYGVELDGITGLIASKLYPNAKIQIKGFEQTSFSDNSFDLVVGNVPFGAYSVYDSAYAKYNFHIHDYFLAKSIDKLKPNGIMAVITTKGTMDKLNSSNRKYLADRAELIGAIRLPNNAFKQSAGTEAVADILFFKKREEKIDATSENTEWLDTVKIQGYDVNKYFESHPEMVLGEFKEERGLYGALSLTVEPKEESLESQLERAINLLPESIYVNPERNEEENESEEIEIDYDIRPLCFKAVDGKLYVRNGEKMEKVEIPERPQNAYERISAMIDLRNELRHVLEIQINECSEETLKEEQEKLNYNYERFVKKYGNLNNQTNTKLFKDDGDSALLFSCEIEREDKSGYDKAEIFSKRTIRPYTAINKTQDCFEALQISKNERAKVDIAFIEEITEKDYDTVIKELGTNVFRNPTKINPEDKYSGFETAEEYLSGNVVTKLRTARIFKDEHPEIDISSNITSLEEVQPTPIKAADIAVHIGMSWIDKDYYKQFIEELIELPYYYMDYISVYLNPFDSVWTVKANGLSYVNTTKTKSIYGTERASFFRLFEDCLNGKTTTIYDTVEEDGREKRVINQKETISAREKQNKIKEEFRNWIFKDPTRREILEGEYNAKFNQIRLPSYDGSYLKFPEMNPAIELRPHQKNAVHRSITTGNTLLHHVVGSGKTFTICATVMKLRQYGLAKKPLIAVPNHLVQQWGNDFRTLYPNAKLLIAGKDDLTKENRQKFVSKVALGDWDAIIMAQSSFAKISISKERQIAKMQEELQRIEETIENEKFIGDRKGTSVKQLEQVKKSRESQLKKLMDSDSKDTLLKFEDLGVDYLFVDEAHFYKNKFLFTKMNNVSGISTTASQRATDMQLKVEYINELHGGDIGVVFATGTPISNSMTEMYTMQSYLQRETLEESGINFFDLWASNFGETVTSLELAPSGQGYRAKTRFAKFTNLPELLTFYRSFADVQTSDTVKLDVPTAEKEVITLKPSDTVLDLADEIVKRAERINGGGVDPHEDNMLKVTSDGKKLALDPRCMDKMAGDEAGSKVNVCADKIYEIYNFTNDMKGTQLVFCDLSTPKKAFEDYVYGEDFDVYNDLKYKLVNKGIPKEEIAYIHDAKTDEQKQELFNKVNKGKIRILIGSTEKCGAGTNIQERLYALHHLDTPYRPSDMEQREGRIIRQGNMNGTVKIFTYVTERTFDSYSYQILENKQRFISQINRGDLSVREAEDIDETTLTYAEIKAITSANPKIKRKMEVDTEIARLRVLEGEYKRNLYTLQDNVRKNLPERIARQEIYLENLKKDVERLKANKTEDFSINVLGHIYTDKKEGGMAFLDALYGKPTGSIVAEYYGFKISLEPIKLLTNSREIRLKCNGEYLCEIGDSWSGNLTRIIGMFPKKCQSKISG